MKGLTGCLPIIFLGVFILLCLSVEIQGNSERIYVVAFPLVPSLPDSDYETKSRRLIISLSGVGPAQVHVNAPNSLESLDETFTLTDASETKTLSIENSVLFLTGSNLYTASGIQIESTKPLEVIAATDLHIIRSNAATFSGSSFHVFPIDQLASTYQIVTTCQKTDCFIVVTSTADNNGVNVKLALEAYNDETENELTYRGTTYRNSETIHQTLEAYESLQILAVGVDMTGSVVSSSHPIAVACGGVLDSVPEYVNTDAAHEQIPPIDSLGDHYVIGGFPSTLGDSYRIIMTASDEGEPALKEVKIVGQENVDFDSGTVLKQIVHLNTEETVIVTAKDDFLMIIQTPYTSQTYDREDAASIVATPTKRWQHYYTTIIHPSTPDDAFIMIMTYASCSDPFHVEREGRMVASPDDSWRTTGEFKATFIDITSTEAGPINIYNWCCLFGGFVYVVERYKSKAYTLSWQNDVVSSKKCPSAVEETTIENTTPLEETTQTTPEAETTQTTPEAETTQTTPEAETTQTTPEAETTQTTPDAETTQTTPEAETTQTTPDAETTQTTPEETTPFETTPRRTELTTQQISESDTTTKGVYANTSGRLCPCKCNEKVLEASRITACEKKIILKKIVKTLELNTSDLSSTIRSKTSALDRRASATVIGLFMAFMLIGLIALLVIVPDLLSLLYYFYNLHNSRVDTSS